jgi:tetratricopeptide (TPR) repeat protein
MARAASLRDLEEERDFLLRSISDLDRERAANDLTEADYRRLRDGYTVRAADVMRRLEALGPAREPGGDTEGDAGRDDDGTPVGHNAPEPQEPPAEHDSATPAAGAVQVAARRPRRHRWLGGGGAGAGDGEAGRARGRRRRGVVALAVIVCFVAAAAGLVFTRATHRLPGQTASGSVTLADDQRLAQELVQARVLATQGKDLDAIKLYDKVLAVEPRQPEALAYRGWLLRLAGVAGHDQGLLAQGRASVGAAVARDPSYPDARVFLGYILFQDAHDPVGATAQFRAFLADHPQAQMVTLTSDVVARAFAAVGQPVPPASSPSGS